MLRAFVAWMGVVVAGASAVPAMPAAEHATLPPVAVPLFAVSQTRAASVSPRLSGPHLSILDQYCVTCHDARSKAGGLVLDPVDGPDSGASAHTWERVVRQLRAGTMPPAGAPRPDPATQASLVAAIEAALDRAAAPHPGRTVVHRLNRAEYANAIRDLLHLEIDVESMLPADESLQGFDNIGGALSVSPLLLERYLSAARRISRLAVGDLTIGPAFASRTYEASQTVYQNARMSEDLPFGSRGGLVVRHRFPLDGEYVCRIRLLRNILGYVRGLASAHQLEVRLDGRRLKRFTVGGQHVGQPAPLGFTGVFAGDPAWEHYALTADDDLEVRFRASAGTHLVTVSFVDDTVVQEGVQQPPLTGLGLSYSEFAIAPDGSEGPAVDSLSVEGPYEASGVGETASRARIFACRPVRVQDEDACARRILSTLARRAYRRPVTNTERDSLLVFFRSGQSRRGFDEGIRSALERLLVDPNFLFRLERDPVGIPAGVAYPVSALELASRLSFFLCSSVPDDELLDAAVRGALDDPAVLDAQVARLLGGTCTTTLVENFTTQWLSLRQLRQVAPDPVVYSEFDGNLREAFEQETVLFVTSQVQEDRGVLGLLTADYTFVNERLARHYGISGIYGNHFRRVVLDADVRGGLLGHGSILTVTSYPTRTSPVLRGRWLLDNILGTPPPPPPPDIPALPSAVDNDRGLSMRQRTERHRRNPTCARCHVRMDPLGFALENFDAIGRWREREDLLGVDERGETIDASGVFPDGTTFAGLPGLRTLVTTHPEEFVRTVTEKLMTYALGRTVEYYDMPAIRKIIRDAEPSGYRWSRLIRGIVRSVPFRMRGAS